MGEFLLEETEVIRANRMRTTCFVVAERGNCLDLRAEEIRRVSGRRFVPVSGATLPRTLPPSWMLAVIVCPGDDSGRVAAWTKGLGFGQSRLVFFYETQQGLDVAAFYRAWVAKRLPDPARRRPKNFVDLCVALGADLNRRILADHRPPPPRT